MKHYEKKPPIITLQASVPFWFSPHKIITHPLDVCIKTTRDEKKGFGGKEINS